MTRFSTAVVSSSPFDLMRLPVILPLAFCLVSVACHTSLAVAQPVAPPLLTLAGNEKSDAKIWYSYQKQVDDQKIAVKDATDLFLRFLRAGAKSSPSLSPNVAINVWDMVIDRVARTQRDPEGGLVLCDEALALYGGQRRGGILVAAKLRILVYESRPQDAQALVEANWEPIGQVPVSVLRRILWYYCLALQSQGQPELMVPVLKKMMVQNSLLLDEEYQSTNGWMYRYLVRELLAEGKTDEALSWAKLRWMECPFDTENVEGAASLLAQVWKAQGQDVPGKQAALVQFSKAQQNVEVPVEPTVAPQPMMATHQALSDVSLPVIEAKELQEQLTRLSSARGQVLNEQNTHQRIGLLILDRQWGQAMLEARQLWLDPPTALQGVKEITRIFKARDLDVMRANAFLEWLDTNQGPNPLIRFFEQNPINAKDPLDFLAVPKFLDTKAIIPQVKLKSDPTAWRDGVIKLNDFVFDMSARERLKDSPFEDMVQRDMLRAMLNTANTNMSLEEALKVPQTKRWVGYAYAGIGDERAVPLLEEVLDNTPQPVTTKATAVDLTYLLLCLSSYYEKKGELIKAADTELRVLDYFDDDKLPKEPEGAKVPVAGMIANHVIGAARLYQKAGEQVKAKELYAQVTNYGYAWATGLALFDQARILIDQNQNELARKLLQQPNTGLYADQIKVITTSLLAYSYYRTGDLDTARRYSEEAITLYKAVKDPITEDGVSDEEPKYLLSWIEKWKTQPLLVEPHALQIKLDSNTPETIRYLTLQSSQPIPVTVESDRTEVKVDSSQSWVSTQYFYSKRIAITIPSAEAKSSFTALLTASSTQFPKFSLPIPIQVEVQPSVKLSVSSIFFGSIKVNEATSQTLKLSSSKPFRILSAESDTSGPSGLQVKLDTPEAALEHSLKLTLKSQDMKQFVEGTLRISTDISAKEVIEVPYVARMQ